MKNHWKLPAVAYALIMLIMGLVACDRGDPIEGPLSTLSMPPIEEMGALHNEFLRTVFQRFDEEAGGSAKAGAPLSAEQEFAIVFATANQMLTRYGLAPMTRAQARRIVDNGRRRMEEMIAAGDRPDSYVQEVFKEDASGLKGGATSYEFFMRYFRERQVAFQKGLDALEAYHRVCDALGAPVAGSNLAMFCDVLVHSDAFWLDHFGPAWLGHGSAAKGWKKLLRIICTSVADAGGGMLTGAGYGALAGPGGVIGGAVAGGIVGGLASYGASRALDD